MDPTLAGYVKEEVVIRYDPADLAVIRVFHQLCGQHCLHSSTQVHSIHLPLDRQWAPLSPKGDAPDAEWYIGDARLLAATPAD